jgi:transposase
MICTVHNIKKIADFIKREGENLKDMLKMIAGGGSKDWNKGGSRGRIANKPC